MKRILCSFALWAMCLSVLQAQEVAVAPAAQASSGGADRFADLERVLLKKLKDIEERLDRLERDRKSTVAAEERKSDQLQRDVTDLKRSMDRVERSVQRLESKR